MIDLYTKAVLTAIALALVALVIKPSFEPQPAAAMKPAAATAECGTPLAPCYVATSALNGTVLDVRVVR